MGEQFPSGVDHGSVEARRRLLAIRCVRVTWRAAYRDLRRLPPREFARRLPQLNRHALDQLAAIRSGIALDPAASCEAEEALAEISRAPLRGAA